MKRWILTHLWVQRVQSNMVCYSTAFPHAEKENIIQIIAYKCISSKAHVCTLPQDKLDATVVPDIVLTAVWSQNQQSVESKQYQVTFM